MKMTNAMVISLTIVALAFIGLLAAGILYSQYTEAETIKACVTSGGEWLRDMGNYYECVKDSK